MRIFKFGGASVKDAASVANIPGILARYQDEPLVIVLSAMGKTTNALEALVDSAYYGRTDASALLEGIMEYHLNTALSLLPESDRLFRQLREFNRQLEERISRANEQDLDYDAYYDQVIPFGELMSTRILSAFLAQEGIDNTWLDARELVITDSTFRAAIVNWEETESRIRNTVLPLLNDGHLVVTQGFIGSSGTFSTSLGREGSDFSAAIFAHCLDASELIVWKDVPGYLNADPQYFDDTVKLDRLSYMECIELAFYGAKIIHPKTIRPLKSKNIPLLVKSFLQPDTPGSIIHEDSSGDHLVPATIIKEDQVLISISSRDYSFIGQDHLHNIFGLFAGHRTPINLMQNSAISFSVCVDNSRRLPALLEALQQTFRVKFNDALQLITIRHYNADIISKLTKHREILLEQKSRLTAQFVVKLLAFPASRAQFIWELLVSMDQY